MGTADTIAGFRSKIAPELTALARPIADCQPHPDNARKHRLPKIAKSLNDHGQRSPIVVQQSTGFIVKGNGTWTAAAQILGWTEIAQVWQELDDDQALAYLMADNKASDESSYDTPKLVKALSKLVDGPGLMDSLWATEELEDLIEAQAGSTVLDPTATGAEFADAAYVDQRSAKGAASGAKHKEVPLVMSLEDHVQFVERLAVLRKRYGTSGTVVTILEAVRRQAGAEEEATAVGRDLDAEQVAKIRRAVVVEVRDFILTDPRYENPTRVQVVALLESAAPQVISPKRESAQVEAFPILDELVAQGADEDVLVESGALDIEEQTAALARYRAAQGGK